MSTPKRVSLKRLRWTSDILSAALRMLKEHGQEKKLVRDVATQVDTAHKILGEIISNEEGLRRKEKEHARGTHSH